MSTPTPRALPDPEISLRDARDFIIGSPLARVAFGGSVWGLPLLLHDLLDAIYRLVKSCHLPEFSALVAVSEDYGSTWSPPWITNLPMATSKPAAGTLSTGQRYLICTTAKNNGGQRTPLTIAVTRPGENVFRKAFVIRCSQHADQPGESADRLSLSYPCAIEHDGHLYVGYFNNGGRRGNLNSAELAIIPIEELRIEPSVYVIRIHRDANH